jgi:hypothetical protein
MLCPTSIGRFAPSSAVGKHCNIMVPMPESRHRDGDINVLTQYARSRCLYASNLAIGVEIGSIDTH